MESRPGAKVRRAAGQIVVARALWYVKPGVAEIRTERLGVPPPGYIRIKTLFSLISRGTERLVAHGDVPQSEYPIMRAPMQAGSFPFPVKYGYSATGVVTAGTEALIGKTVFALHPHQDHFQVPETAAIEVPGGIPARRATLGANMETALNAHWDAGTGPGDKVLVIGAGILGLLIAHLARRIGAEVTICDIAEDREVIARSLGLPFTTPGNAPVDNRLVFHTSANGAGLKTAINSAAFEGRIVELSWYGTNPVMLSLGGTFHSRRLQIISSQVGHVAADRRATVTRRDRLATALSMLDDPRLDGLIAQETAFEDVPARLANILGPDRNAGAPLIRYPDH
jgi:NADPH:quinone reductase-like Zn-dependent oxidoreductase